MKEFIPKKSRATMQLHALTAMYVEFMLDEKREPLYLDWGEARVTITPKPVQTKL